MANNDTSTGYDSGPWYEQEGPTANYVRKDMFQKIKNGKIFKVEIADQHIERILLEHIPETKTDFGSWRGYGTFGLEKAILNNIETDIKKLIADNL